MAITNGYKRGWRSNHPLYATWKSMRQRCIFKDEPNYKGRGITICERWDDFANFVEDMGEKPSPKHSIDRIDNDKGYSPDNCRWATAREQSLNKRIRKDANLNSWWRRTHSH